MKALIVLEELGMFLFSIFIFASLPFAWWWFPLLILVPDLSMSGYRINNRVGAVLYNIVHHKALALLIIMLGYYLRNDILLLIGTILFGHSSMDRMFWYGLKYFSGIKYTHLGEIGK